MSDPTPPAGRSSLSRAVRQHLVLVVAILVLGLSCGYYLSSSEPATYTSTTRVLVNPADGNPFVPTPSAVRQDELTSLETEAQVATSAEVLTSVAADTGLKTTKLQKGLSVIVPPNTQILEITFTTTDRDIAQKVADDVANTYLSTRTARFEEVNSARIAKVETHTEQVVADLRTATKAAQEGSAADKEFQSQLADALRNELVSLRAQRTALDNSEAPSGSVITAASAPAAAGGITTLVMPVGGAVAGLVLGCLVALLLERLTGRVRATQEVLDAGLPVIAEVPRAGLRSRLALRARVRRAAGTELVDTTLRRLRATLLELEPRPEIIAITPAGHGPSNGNISEAVAASFAKAGHRVALVRTDSPADQGGLGAGDTGLAQLLLHERLNAVTLLQPSVDPLLSILPDGGFTSQSRELLVADRLRSVLAPLIETGYLVVIQAPGLDSPEAEAYVGAADLGLVVVTLDRTLPRDLAQAGTRLTTGSTTRAAMVLRRGQLAGRTVRSDLERDDASVESRDHVAAEDRSRTPR